MANRTRETSDAKVEEEIRDANEDLRAAKKDLLDLCRWLSIYGRDCQHQQIPGVVRSLVHRTEVNRAMTRNCLLRADEVALWLYDTAKHIDRPYDDEEEDARVKIDDTTLLAWENLERWTRKTASDADIAADLEELHFVIESLNAYEDAHNLWLESIIHNWHPLRPERSARWVEPNPQHHAQLVAKKNESRYRALAWPTERRKPAASYRDAEEVFEKPEAFKYGPLQGTLIELGAALGGKGQNLGRTVQQKAKKGIILVIKQNRTTYDAWFKDPERFRQAQKCLRPRTPDAGSPRPRAK